MHDPKLEMYIKAIVPLMADARTEVEQALGLIAKQLSGQPVAQQYQLLALRRYLRMGPKRVRAQWAWTPEEAAAFGRTAAGQALDLEAQKVQAAFAAKNPGYSLGVSPLRSLERQVVLWTNNNTVKGASQRLHADMLTELRSGAFPEPPDLGAANRFSRTLRFAAVTPEPSSAAPGTSDHGQARAVDFVVKRGATTIASTETAQIPTVWQAGGWERRLIEATKGTRLVGPLKNPYEPWHWRLDR